MAAHLIVVDLTQPHLLKRTKKAGQANMLCNFNQSKDSI